MALIRGGFKLHPTLLHHYIIYIYLRHPMATYKRVHGTYLMFGTAGMKGDGKEYGL